MRKTLHRILLMAGILTVFVQFSFSQTTRVITGTVQDAKGETLPGASVSIKGTTIGILTDINGKYSLNVPAEAKILVYSFIGTNTQEVTIGDKKVIDVTLSSATKNLEDVVVIGYGTQKRGDVNGAISSISAAEIENIPQVSVDQLLQGKAAGLVVSQNSGAPGSNTSVHIRGVTSLSLSSEPLYVIDGVPISGDANNIATSGRSASLSNKGQSGAGDGQTSVSPLALINPNDIESIDVLKDASATAIYGSRASNGVIIITTKRGKNGSARISYDGYYGFQKQGKFLDVLNLKDYAKLQNSLADAIGQPRRTDFADPTLLGEGTNWQEEVFRTANQQNHQLSISGGKEGLDYYISGGYLDQTGTILGSDFKRYSFRSNLNSQVKKWFKVGMNLSGNRSAENQALSDNGGIVYTAVLSAPDVAVRNADGTFAGPPANQVGQQVFNPVATALDQTHFTSRNKLNGSLYADLNFFKDLSLHSELDGDFNFSKARVFQPTFKYGESYSNQTAKLSEYEANSTYWGWKEYLTYNHVYAQKHNLTALAGYELSRSDWNGVDATIQNFLSNDLQTLNLGDIKTATLGEYKYVGDILQSVFGRAIYTYNSKYSLTATLRADRSSKFAQGHQTGYFPSAAVSWRLSEEKFMEGLKEYVDDIKIRAGYGQVGNQGLPVYRYGTALASFPTGLGTAFAIDRVPNVNVTWEKAQQTDIGIDLSLFKTRINASFDYFDKSSKDFLFQKPLPAYVLGGQAEYSSTGVISSPYINGGKLTNKGFDFSISSKNIVGKDFKWSTSVVFSHYKNKVISLAEGIPEINGNVTVSFLSLPITKTVPGGSVGEFYGLKVKGIFKTDDQLRNAPVQFGYPIANPLTNGGSSETTWLGDIQYEDINNDGVIDDNDRTFIGNPNPKFTYGITNNFSYKNFDLSIFLNGSYGAKIYNAINYSIAGLGGLYVNQIADVADFWTPDNPDSNTPAPRNGNNANLRPSDRYIESGSYLRIQNVNLGYTIPSRFSNKLKLSRLKVYVSGQNLYVFTPYKGLDPEVGALNQNVFLTNVDLGRYPVPRTITFGINAEF